MTIADDGRGITAEAGVPAGAQRGLRNMQLRAQQIGGVLEVASRPSGTTLTLRVPVFAADAGARAPANTPVSG